MNEFELYELVPSIVSFIPNMPFNFGRSKSKSNSKLESDSNSSQFNDNGKCRSSTHMTQTGSIGNKKCEYVDCKQDEQSINELVEILKVSDAANPLKKLENITTTQKELIELLLQERKKVSRPTTDTGANTSYFEWHAWLNSFHQREVIKLQEDNKRLTGEVGKLSDEVYLSSATHELCNLEIENRRLVDENKKLSDTNNLNSETQNECYKLQDERRSLVNENSHLFEENRKLLQENNLNSAAKSELSKLNKKYSCLVEENAKILDEKDSIFAAQNKLNKEFNLIFEENRNLSEKNDLNFAAQSKLSKLQEEKKRLVEENRNLLQKNNLNFEIQRKYSKLQEENGRLVDKIAELWEKIDLNSATRFELRKMQEENGMLSNENNLNSIAQNKLNNIKEEYSRLVKENIKLSDEMNLNSSAQTELKKLKEEYSRLDEEKGKLLDRNIELDLELSSKQKSCKCGKKLAESLTMKSVNVDMYCPGGSQTVDKIEEAFKRDLQNLCLKLKIELHFHMADSSSPLKQPAVVLCPAYSRLESDVNSVFSGTKIIQDKSDGIALVVIHSNQEHSLPKIKSEQILSAKYGHLGIILDMAFTMKRGFYPCKINQSSCDALLHFFDQYSI